LETCCGNVCLPPESLCENGQMRLAVDGTGPTTTSKI
jgi:hypothetical protein